MVYDEDKDHYYLNAVGKEEVEEVSKEKSKVVFWNCNGWGWGDASEKCSLLARMVLKEGADMVCLLDTRLADVQELWAIGQIISTMERITGKVWGHRAVSKKRSCLLGGMIVLHSDSWGSIKIREIIPYGCAVEINGKWNGECSKIIAVYRPSSGVGPKSFRKTLEDEYDEKFEEVFWSKIGDAAKIGPTMIGGDFNMDKRNVDKKVNEVMGCWGKRCELAEERGTYRAWDTINAIEHHSEIDHVVWCGGGNAGVKLVGECGITNDHIPLVGWVEMEGKKKNVRRVKMDMPRGLKSTDKGASVKFCKIMDRLGEERLEKMDMEGIIKFTMDTVRRVSKDRKTQTNPNGFSAASRVMSLRLSVHRTAARMQGMGRYMEVLKLRVNNLKKLETSITMTDEEREWFGEHGLDVNPLDWTCWKKRY